MTFNGVDLDKLLHALEYCDIGSCRDCAYYVRCLEDDCQCQLHKDAREVIETLSEMALKESVLKNCVNCDHAKVCQTVHTRRVTKANVYTPCEHWKQIEE